GTALSKTLPYCVANVGFPRAWSTAPMGFANEPPEPPAKQRPTGLLPVSVTMSEPESPELMKFPGVMIWPVKVVVPAEYPTLIVTLIAWIVPWVKWDVRPDFLTARPTDAAVTEFVAVYPPDWATLQVPVSSASAQSTVLFPPKLMFWYWASVPICGVTAHLGRPS